MWLNHGCKFGENGANQATSILCGDLRLLKKQIHNGTWLCISGHSFYDVNLHFLELCPMNGGGHEMFVARVKLKKHSAIALVTLINSQQLK